MVSDVINSLVHNFFVLNDFFFSFNPYNDQNAMCTIQCKQYNVYNTVQHLQYNDYNTMSKNENVLIVSKKGRK